MNIILRSKKKPPLASLNISLNELGVFVDSHWPYAYYPLAGYHLGLVQTRWPVPSEAYFDEGLLAEEFKHKRYQVYFDDGIVVGPDNPWLGGKVYALLQDCTANP